MVCESVLKGVVMASGWQELLLNVVVSRKVPRVLFNGVAIMGRGFQEVLYDLWIAPVVLWRFSQAFLIHESSLFIAKRLVVCLLRRILFVQINQRALSVGIHITQQVLGVDFRLQSAHSISSFIQPINVRIFTCHVGSSSCLLNIYFFPYCKHKVYVSWQGYFFFWLCDKI